MILSVLIVNWNSKEFLRNCIKSLQQNEGDVSMQIVVVDGGSFDGCGEMVSAEFPTVEFVQAKENLGFGRSNNLGIEKLKGAFVLLLNPDTVVKPGAIQGLLDAQSQLPQMGMIGPKILNPDGSVQITCARPLPTPLNQALGSEFLQTLFPKTKLVGRSDAIFSDVPIEVEALSGACMLLRTEVFKKVGGFSPEFFMYGEDYDLCFKVRSLGLKNYFVPGSQIIHFGGQSSGQQFKKFPVVWMRESDYAVIRKWRGASAAFLYRFLQGVSGVVRILLQSARLPFCGTETASASARASLRKWWTVIRWSLGLERWAKVHLSSKRVRS